MHSEIDAAELLYRLGKGERLKVLDVREAIEYHTFNIGGINVPLNTLKANPSTISSNKNEELIVICSAGLRSATAAALLSENGYTNIKNLTGGLRALQKLKN